MEIMTDKISAANRLRTVARDNLILPLALAPTLLTWAYFVYGKGDPAVSGYLRAKRRADFAFL